MSASIPPTWMGWSFPPKDHNNYYYPMLCRLLLGADPNCASEDGATLLEQQLLAKECLKTGFHLGKFAWGGKEDFKNNIDIHECH